MSVETGSILVPLDISALSHRALEHAERLARALDVGLVLFTAVGGAERVPLQAFAKGEGISLEVAADAYLSRVAHSMSGDVPTEAHHVVHSRPASAIVDFATANDISMIVMASHGESGLDRWLLGSTAHKVVESASVPVLIVPVRA